jgi:hypothetical protein
MTGFRSSSETIRGQVSADKLPAPASVIANRSLCSSRFRLNCMGKNFSKNFHQPNINSNPAIEFKFKKLPAQPFLKSPALRSPGFKGTRPPGTSAFRMDNPLYLEKPICRAARFQ